MECLGDFVGFRDRSYLLGDYMDKDKLHMVLA